MSTKRMTTELMPPNIPDRMTLSRQFVDVGWDGEIHRRGHIEDVMPSVVGDRP